MSMNSHPILLYDDTCKLCSVFATLITKMSKGYIIPIGHYTKEGYLLEQVLGSDTKTMFWIIDERIAYGGRCALVPLLKSIIKSRLNRYNALDINFNYCNKCTHPCSLIKRLGSLLTNAKKVELDNEHLLLKILNKLEA